MYTIYTYIYISMLTYVNLYLNVVYCYSTQDFKKIHGLSCMLCIIQHRKKIHVLTHVFLC